MKTKNLASSNKAPNEMEDLAFFKDSLRAFITSDASDSGVWAQGITKYLTRRQLSRVLYYDMLY